MKKIITYLFILLLLSCQECKKNNNGPKYNETDLYGTWHASINNWCDTNNSGYNNKVIMEFDPGNVAYLNYNGSKGNLWSSSYKCKWWINYTNVPFSHYDNTNYQSFLYILRFDSLGVPCWNGHCGCCFFPDTNIYDITNLNSNTLNLQLGRVPGCFGNDMFFCTPSYPPNSNSGKQTLYK
jgi:hypothetical protein